MRSYYTGGQGSGIRGPVRRMRGVGAKWWSTCGPPNLPKRTRKCPTSSHRTPDPRPPTPDPSKQPIHIHPYLPVAFLLDGFDGETQERWVEGVVGDGGNGEGIFLEAGDGFEPTGNGDVREG